jgi:hypothetical protein
MSATGNIGQSFSPLLINKRSDTDTSTHLASDEGSNYAIKDLSRAKQVRTPISARRGAGSGMMTSQEMAIAMPRAEYAGSSGIGTGTSLLYQEGAGHIDFKRPNEEG